MMPAVHGRRESPVSLSDRTENSRKDDIFHVEQTTCELGSVNKCSTNNEYTVQYAPSACQPQTGELRCKPSTCKRSSDTAARSCKLFIGRSYRSEATSLSARLQNDARAVWPQWPRCLSHLCAQLRSSPSHSSVTSTCRRPAVTGDTQWNLWLTKTSASPFWKSG